MRVALEPGRESERAQRAGHHARRSSTSRSSRSSVALGCPVRAVAPLRRLRRSAADHAGAGTGARALARRDAPQPAAPTRRSRRTADHRAGAAHAQAARPPCSAAPRVATPGRARPWRAPDACVAARRPPRRRRARAPRSRPSRASRTLRRRAAAARRRAAPAARSGEPQRARRARLRRQRQPQVDSRSADRQRRRRWPRRSRRPASARRRRSPGEPRARPHAPLEDGRGAPARPIPRRRRQTSPTLQARLREAEASAMPTRWSTRCRAGAAGDARHLAVAAAVGACSAKQQAAVVGRRAPKRREPAAGTAPAPQAARARASRRRVSAAGDSPWSTPSTAAGQPRPTTCASRRRPFRELDVNDAPKPRDVSVEELIDLEQQAEFFVVLGQDEAAIDLLMGHLRSTGGISPLPYLKLLEIYRRRGDREPTSASASASTSRFNAYAPDWDSDLQHGRSLDDYPDVMQRLQDAWPTPPHAMDGSRRCCSGAGGGDAAFDLPAYRELLFLYSMARDLLEHDGIADRRRRAAAARWRRARPSRRAARYRRWLAPIRRSSDRSASTSTSSRRVTSRPSSRGRRRRASRGALRRRDSPVRLTHRVELIDRRPRRAEQQAGKR